MWEETKKDSLFALALLLPLAPAHASLEYSNTIEKVNPWYGEDYGRVRARTYYGAQDYLLYESLTIEAKLYSAPIGTTNWSLATETYTSGGLIPNTPWRIQFEDDYTIVPGCGDRKWKFRSGHGYFLANGTGQTTYLETIKVITWVQ